MTLLVAPVAALAPNVVAVRFIALSDRPQSQVPIGDPDDDDEGLGDDEDGEEEDEDEDEEPRQVRPVGDAG